MCHNGLLHPRALVRPTWFQVRALPIQPNPHSTSGEAWRINYRVQFRKQFSLCIRALTTHTVATPTTKPPLQPVRRSKLVKKRSKLKCLISTVPLLVGLHYFTSLLKMSTIQQTHGMHPPRRHRECRPSSLQVLHYQHQPNDFMTSSKTQVRGLYRESRNKVVSRTALCSGFLVSTLSNNRTRILTNRINMVCHMTSRCPLSSHHSLATTNQGGLWMMLDRCLIDRDLQLTKECHQTAALLPEAHIHRDKDPAKTANSLDKDRRPRTLILCSSAEEVHLPCDRAIKSHLGVVPSVLHCNSRDLTKTRKACSE